MSEERCLMGLFDFLKRGKKQEESIKNNYWSLTTIEGEVTEPTIEQIQTAVKKATPDGSMFAILTYNHSGLEVEGIQTVSDDNSYRFEAIASDGKIYVKDGLTYEKTVELFEHFFNYQRVSGFRSWPIEKHR